MNSRCRAVICSILLSAAPAAGAAEVMNAEVERSAERYKVGFTVLLEGELSRVWAIITDYAGLADISPAVTRSRVLNGAGGHDARIELTLRPCVLVIFCKTVTKVSDARIDADGLRVEYRVVPALSDFHEARETITLEPETTGGAPRVRFAYSAVLKPKFYVPPFVGPWLIRRAVIQDLEASSRRVERILRPGDRRQ